MSLPQNYEPTLKQHLGFSFFVIHQLHSQLTACILPTPYQMNQSHFHTPAVALYHRYEGQGIYLVTVHHSTCSRMRVPADTCAQMQILVLHTTPQDNLFYHSPYSVLCQVMEACIILISPQGIVNLELPIATTFCVLLLFSLIICIKTTSSMRRKSVVTAQSKQEDFVPHDSVGVIFVICYT